MASCASASTGAGDRFSKTNVVSPAAATTPAATASHWLQVRRTLERGAQGAAKPTTSLDLSAARRTRVQMLQDVVIRFRQQLITQKRIGDFSNVTAGHDASILSSWAFTV